MKNFILLMVAFLSFSFSYAQENNLQETDGLNATIEQLLRDAEESINSVNFDQALRELNRALELSRAVNHQRLIALSSSLMAQLHYVRHENDKAATELQRAISIQREIGDEAGLAYSYLNYGKIFTAKRIFERATEYFDLSETLYTKLGDTEGLGNIDLNRGILYLNTSERPHAALSYFNSAEEKLQASTNEYERVRIHFYKARALLATGKLDQAMAEANKSLFLAKKNNFGGMIQHTYWVQSRIQEEAGNHAEALSLLKVNNQMRDSLYNLNKEALASDASARYGVDAMKSTVSELTKRQAENERTLKVNKLTTILSVALITILSLLTLSLYKNNNLRARANDLLQKKNSELVTAKENAEKASLAKAQFLSTITHELRTPLYAVTGLTHLLLEESPTENQKEHLNSLKFSGEYLLSLINNILDLNKLEAKKVEMLESSFNLKKRITDVLVALKNSAEEKKTQLHLEFDSEIPKKLKGDPLKISQILINLVGNSIKFTENGDIWVRVKKSGQDGALVKLRFEIEDTGEGISKEKQKAIFENFTQGSLQINRKFGGTGLGLSIVKNLLNLMDSEIHLESELGKGSVFYFELSFEALEPAAPQDPKSDNVIPEPLSNDYMHNKKILIVEDNKINQMITRKILEKNKVICDVADNGTVAIAKVENHHFDLILMDIHMPGISGIEATREIRKFNETIPIIALTAVTLEESLDEFYLNGFNDIIPKPFKTEEFFQKINKYLSQEKATV
ncbi:multi-sensor hybrid histidine kinase [Salinimicrobium sediminis]|uniref:histidine kinase n=1 Tax=Salinimicrobium sediminis TaxID=1343891 RepID=A0A285X692_9FLAO|nr:response regulator [Salinimicrobium sediminis]SOC80867.1 multi-sensor hybrid histidine kinase [Salinimicrobium sediminis]